MRNLPQEDRRSAAGPRRRRRGFGLTWWGEAWVTALEQRARLDPNRLPRGRSYARAGTVGELAVGPGEVRAAVQGRSDRLATAPQPKALAHPADEAAQGPAWGWVGPDEGRRRGRALGGADHLAQFGFVARAKRGRRPPVRRNTSASGPPWL